MEEKGQGAATEVLVQEENKSLTGYFNDGRKRIDIVLVFKNNGSDAIKEMRLNFLMNIIQFGLEAEVETGKIAEHKNLIFVKLHAPDVIIEEYGLYFNEKCFFKDSHLEFVNPIVNILGVANERELIKIVRAQYPGPDNYSTLERSSIVYKILLRMPFGKYRNHFGIDKLIDNYIIQDAFALHDGPYFIVPKQKSTDMNARQVLFYEWVGMINVWKMQPIHMVHEYFGKRISYYFAFYEYFNFMLIIPMILGAFITFRLYVNVYDYKSKILYADPCVVKVDERPFICPECRNYTLCPLMRQLAYCKEVKVLAKMDNNTTFFFGYFITIWGIFFLLPWRYRERYLSWIWEEARKYTNKLVRTEYMKSEMNFEKETRKKWKIKTKITGYTIKILIYILTAVFLVIWSFIMFRFSIIIWHYPRWNRLHGRPRSYMFKHEEHVDMAIGTGIYVIVVYIIKMIYFVLTKTITGWENNKTFFNHDRSIALKMYTFNFISTFAILITYTYIGCIFLKHSSSYHYNFLNGYAMMNNGLGTSFDDISVSVGVITMLEFVVLRIPFFFINDTTDYPLDFDNKVPCWEREYKLKPLTESFFHKRYNDIVMQFALLTCYSMMFPVAPLLFFATNIWDIRHTARQLLLEYRRPLMINTSGPGFWKILIIVTSLYGPASHTAIIIFQSIHFLRRHMIPPNYPIYAKFNTYGYINKVSATKADFNRMIPRIGKYYPKYTKKCITFRARSLVERGIKQEKEVRYLFFLTAIGFVLALFLFYIIPKTSNSLEDAIKKEKRIKYKYHTLKGFAK